MGRNYQLGVYQAEDQFFVAHSLDDAKDFLSDTEREPPRQISNVLWYSDRLLESLNLALSKAIGYIPGRGLFTVDMTNIDGVWSPHYFVTAETPPDALSTVFRQYYPEDFKPDEYPSYQIECVASPLYYTPAALEILVSTIEIQQPFKK